MKQFALILLLFASNSVFAQTVLPHSEPKFSFGFTFSPAFAYRTLAATTNGDWLVKDRDEGETARLGFTTGLAVNYRVQPRLYLESGLQLADKGYKHRFNFVAIDPGSLSSDPAIPEKGTMRYHYYFFSIPVKANYCLLQNDTRLFLSLGVSADYLLAARQKSVFHFPEETRHDNQAIDADINTFNISGLAGLGIEKNMAPQLQLRVEPAFRYVFLPLAHGFLKEHLYSFGVNLTLLYKAGD